NHVAHQLQTGEAANEPDKSPLRFGHAMPVIEPGNPGNSYLLYKLLISPHAQTGSEVHPLREGLVVGMWMPPRTIAPTPPTDVENVSTWIAQGAKPAICN